MKRLAIIVAFVLSTPLLVYAEGQLIAGTGGGGSGGGGGGGTSDLAVENGGVIISSPTAIIDFSSNTFSVTQPTTGKSFVDLSNASKGPFIHDSLTPPTTTQAFFVQTAQISTDTIQGITTTGTAGYGVPIHPITYLNGRTLTSDGNIFYGAGSVGGGDLSFVGVGPDTTSVLLEGIYGPSNNRRGIIGVSNNPSPTIDIFNPTNFLYTVDISSAGWSPTIFYQSSIAGLIDSVDYPLSAIGPNGTRVSASPYLAIISTPTLDNTGNTIGPLYIFQADTSTAAGIMGLENSGGLPLFVMGSISPSVPSAIDSNLYMPLQPQGDILGNNPLGPALLMLGGTDQAGPPTFLYMSYEQGTNAWTALDNNGNYVFMDSSGCIHWDDASVTCSASAGSGTITYIQAGTDITTSVSGSTTTVNVSTSAFVLNQNTLQAGTTFYVSSGTVQGQLTVSTESVTVLYSPFHHTTEVAGTITVDWNTGNNQYVQISTSTANFSMINPRDGAHYYIKFVQPASGTGGTFTFPGSIKWPDSITPVLTTTNSHADTVSLIYDGTSSIYNGGYNTNYSQ